ncbi:hypothetical protein ACQ4PT_001060 [Festuca glaucescens]
MPAGVEFPALETLSLSGCIVDLESLLSRCPRLVVLRLKPRWIWVEDDDLTVHSASLQELVVDTEVTWISRVDIIAPMLKQLTMSLCLCEEFNISILAPMVEKVSWHCRYGIDPVGFDLWQLERIRLQKDERQGHETELAFLQIHAYNTIFLPYVDNFAHEIENHIIAEFSVLELNLTTKGHVFGAFEKEACLTNCPCEPMNWRTQIIALTSLGEVEINGFEGEDHALDFQKLIFKSAPILKRMIVKLSGEVSTSNDGCNKIYDIFKVYSSVDCYIYHSSGKYICVFHA